MKIVAQNRMPTQQKLDLLIDGYQVLYLKLDQQMRLLKRIQQRVDASVNTQMMAGSAVPDPADAIIHQLSPGDKTPV